MVYSAEAARFCQYNVICRPSFCRGWRCIICFFWLTSDKGAAYFRIMWMFESEMTLSSELPHYPNKNLFTFTVCPSFTAIFQFYIKKVTVRTTPVPTWMKVSTATCHGYTTQVLLSENKTCIQTTPVSVLLNVASTSCPCHTSMNSRFLVVFRILTAAL